MDLCNNALRLNLPCTASMRRVFRMGFDTSIDRLQHLRCIRAVRFLDRGRGGGLSRGAGGLPSAGWTTCARLSASEFVQMAIGPEKLYASPVQLPLRRCGTVPNTCSRPHEENGRGGAANGCVGRRRRRAPRAPRAGLLTGGPAHFARSPDRNFLPSRQIVCAIACPGNGLRTRAGFSIGPRIGLRTSGYFWSVLFRVIRRAIWRWRPTSIVLSTTPPVGDGSIPLKFLARIPRACVPSNRPLPVLGTTRPDRGSRAR